MVVEIGLGSKLREENGMAGLGLLILTGIIYLILVGN
jgi:hypothetical protein